MGMGCTRAEERVSAAVGLLVEAPTRFETAQDVAGGGVLWALPALVANGLLEHTRELFHPRKGFYSVVHVFLLLGYMALARIRTIEQLRYHPPGEWGKLLGLDRVPELRNAAAEGEGAGGAGNGPGVGPAARPTVDGRGAGTGGDVVCGRACAGLSWRADETAAALRGAGEVVPAGDHRLLGERPAGAAVFRGWFAAHCRVVECVGGGGGAAPVAGSAGASGSGKGAG